MMVFLNEQLHFLQFLQGFRSPLIDWFFRFLNLFDTDLFAIFLIIFVLIACSMRWGVRLGFLLIANGLLNYVMKQAFALPRPGLFDASLPMIPMHGFGFPSGGAQGACLLGLLILYYWRSRFAAPLGIFYLLLISFSRLFLGVHFPIDILGGWVLGGLVFVAFVKWVNPIEKFASSRPAVTLALTLGGAALFTAIFPYPRIIFFMAATASLAIGIFLKGSQKKHL